MGTGLVIDECNNVSLHVHAVTVLASAVSVKTLDEFSCESLANLMWSACTQSCRHHVCQTCCLSVLLARPPFTLFLGSTVLHKGDCSPSTPQLAITSMVPIHLAPRRPAPPPGRGAPPAPPRPGGRPGPPPPGGGGGPPRGQMYGHH